MQTSLVTRLPPGQPRHRRPHHHELPVLRRDHCPTTYILDSGGPDRLPVTTLGTSHDIELVLSEFLQQRGSAGGLLQPLHSAKWNDAEGRSPKQAHAMN